MYKKTFVAAIMAGVSISLGCVAFLALGGIPGAVLFSFGLITVINNGYKLYTGVSGFVASRMDMLMLPVVLVGNIVGCAVMGAGIRYLYETNEGSALFATMNENLMKLIDGRLQYNVASAFILSILCGLIMTLVVKEGRDKKFLPLVFGIPMFILCGYLHSIADAFYITALPLKYIGEHIGDIAIYYAVIVVGNFVGCNAYRFNFVFGKE